MNDFEEPLPYKKIKNESILENCIKPQNKDFYKTHQLQLQLNFMKCLIQQKQREIVRYLNIKNELELMKIKSSSLPNFSLNIGALSDIELKNDELIKANLTDPFENKQNASGKSVIKAPQSKFKNIYGLILGRIIKSCKNYIRMRPEQVENIQETSRYYYIHNKICLIDNKEDFEKYLKTYNFNNQGTTRNRSKTTVFKFLMKNIQFGLILIELVQEFLKKDNQDLKDYIYDRERAKRTAKVLDNDANLKQLQEIFKKIQSEIKSMSEKQQNSARSKIVVEVETI